MKSFKEFNEMNEVFDTKSPYFKAYANTSELKPLHRDIVKKGVSKMNNGEDHDDVIKWIMDRVKTKSGQEEVKSYLDRYIK